MLGASAEIAAISDRLELKRAALRSARYLYNQIQPSGLFVYRRDAARPEWTSKDYNLLRHAGSLYALSEAYTLLDNGNDLHGLFLSAARLQEWLKPLPGLPGTLAAWSQPGINDTVVCEQVKLGGSALPC